MEQYILTRSKLSTKFIQIDTIWKKKPEAVNVYFEELDKR